VVSIFRAAGYSAERRGVGYKGDDMRISELPDYYMEVRRRETLAIPAWCREICEKAAGKKPVLVFRRSRERWFACLPLDDFIELLDNTVGK
jgi:hypothetical protein